MGRRLPLLSFILTAGRTPAAYPSGLLSPPKPGLPGGTVQRTGPPAAGAVPYLKEIVPVRNTSASQRPDAQAIHSGYLALLPRIETQARASFRHVKCPWLREDLVSECIAVGWKWYLGARRSGKDPASFAATFAWLAARSVRSGRRLCGQE